MLAQSCLDSVLNETLLRNYIRYFSMYNMSLCHGEVLDVDTNSLSIAHQQMH
jgi:hypothetical protein